MTFAERPRCLRVAWALDGLFNSKSGYAYPGNARLANMTGLPINKVQEALLTLESDGAIVRVTIVRPNGQNQRVIYPANALIPTPAVGVGVTPTAGVGGHPQQVGVHNLIKKARLPKSELDRARTRGQASAGTGGLGAWHGRGLSEQRSDRRWQGHTPDRGGHGRHVSVCRWPARGCEWRRHRSNCRGQPQG